jgi:hypothetical protein
VLCALVASGCQSNPEPPPLERTAESSTPSPTASPAEAAPTLPAEAKGTSEAAAKAFVRHFFDSLNFAMNTGETDYFRSLAHAGCESCEAIAANIDKTYGVGGSINSRGWLVQSVSLTPHQAGRRPILDLGVLMRPEQVVERSGAEPQSFEGGKQPMTIYLARVNGAWLVTRLDRVA